jgi:hypothetical protein
MTTDNAERSVLLIGKSQLVRDTSVAGLRDLGYKAEATTDFTNVSGRFDVREIETFQLAPGAQRIRKNVSQLAPAAPPALGQRGDPRERDRPPRTGESDGSDVRVAVPQEIGMGPFADTSSSGTVTLTRS